ncbi:MAG: patatin-like phospholipase family protein [Bacteroidales bacterium]|nr:patatin-like phospholipase family protein [Bacteroidales bacterium]
MLFLMTWADGTAQNISIGQNITQQTATQPGKVCRPKVALALSGGGAKAAATIGALKYIEKAGIPIDYIVGTSSGAVVGSLYAYGYRAAEIEKIYHELDWREIFSDLAPLRRKSPRPDRYVPGMLSGEDLTHALDSLFGHYDGQFDSLPIPFRAMAVDAAELNEVCLDSGNLAQAVRASISVPIAFRPVEKEEMVLVDGGILNNLPVDVAYRMGADIVIAIDLMKDCRATQHGRDSISSRGLGAILVWKFARPDLKKYQENRKRASLLIHPDISGYSSTSFDPEETDSLVHRGEMEGQKVWTELQEIAKLCHNVGHDKEQKNNLGK